MSYLAKQMTRVVGDFTEEDVQSWLNHYGEAGYRFVQILPQGIGRAIIIFERLTPQKVVSDDGIVWLEEMIQP